jgi:hypothetical protein
MPTSAQEHITAIQARYLEAPAPLVATAANALEDIINSIFGDPARIGYELLQNADDASAGEGLNNEVQLFLLHQHLVIRHRGLHFSPANVEAICRYGDFAGAEAAEKMYDLQKIGYKGIGFKSVFNIAEKVWILSKDYTFRFDKAHWGGRQLPWQIVPIYSPWEEAPAEAQAFLQPDWVNFILEISPSADKNEIKRKVAELFRHAYVLLFLRHIQRLELQYQDPRSGALTPYRKLERSLEQGIYTLKKAEKGIWTEESRWQLTRFQAPVPPQVQQSLQRLDKRSCPEKLKRAKEVELSFAAKLGENGAIIPLSRPRIFSYLPTEKQYEFPFLANSNFLLNEARTELLDESWNEFIFEQIGYHQFQWFQQLAADERFRYEFASLLVKYADNTPEARNRRLNEGVRRAQQDISFVPVLHQPELRKAPQTIVDVTGLSEGLSAYGIVKESFPEPLEIADPQIKHIERLLKAGANKFGREKLREAIRNSRHFRPPQQNARLLGFLFQRIHHLPDLREQLEWAEVLADTPFLLCQDGALRPPAEAYFPGQPPELPLPLELPFLHPALLDADGAPLREWLSELGVAPPLPQPIVRRALLPLIAREQLKRDEIVPLACFLARHQGQLESSDFERLGLLPVLTTRSNVLPAQECYCSAAYEPALPLEDWLDEDIFVSPHYLKQAPDVEWGRFWRRIGLRQDMELTLREGFFSFTPAFRKEYKAYLDFLQPFLPQHSRQARHGLLNMLTPLYFEHTQNYEFALKYWGILLGPKWKELKQKCAKAQFFHSNGKAPVPSYFEFLTRTQACFPARGGSCRPATEVYSQSLQELVQDWAPISALALTPEQEELIGLRQALALEDCLDLLEQLTLPEDEVDKARLSALYRYMLSRRFQPEELQALLPGRQICLLAVNNSFQPLDELLYFNLPRFAEKNDSPHFVFLELNPEEALAFCTLWNIPAIALQDLELQAEPAEKATPADLFELHWTTKLPLIAALSAATYGRSPAAELQRLENLTAELEFVACRKLSLALFYEEEPLYQKEAYAWKQGERLYYLLPWGEQRTLFELIETAAAYFALERIGREMGLLLVLSRQKALEWLQERGIELDETLAKPQPPKSNREAAPNRFLPVPPDQASKTVPIVIAPTRTLPPAQAAPPSAETNKQAVGRWGEQYVFDNKLIQDYYEQIGVAGVRLKWMNAQAESGAHYDFAVRLPDKSLHYWEVKASTAAEKVSFPISPRGFQFALQQADDYFLIRILGAGSAAPTATILRNPLRLLQEGRLLAHGLSLGFQDSEPR